MRAPVWRVPSRDELVAGYIEEGLTSAELAVRFGIGEARIQPMLVRHGVERRRGGIRAARRGRNVAVGHRS